MLKSEWDIIKRMSKEPDYPAHVLLDYTESLLKEYGHMSELDPDDPVALEYDHYCDQCFSEDVTPLTFTRWLIEFHRSLYVKYD
jgi:hypothetical protein